MDSPARLYAARLTIDYPERLDRITTLFRLTGSFRSSSSWDCSQGPGTRPWSRRVANES